MNNITSFELACAEKGISTTLPDMSSWPSSLRRPILALYKLTVIRDAIVGGWVPDWDNSDQPKWYAWFYMNKPGFRLGVIDFDWTASHSGTGSRLVFATKEQAKYAADTFLELYKEWMALMPEAQTTDEQTIETPGVFAPLKLRSSTKVMAIKAAILWSRNRNIDVVAKAIEIHDWLTA